MNFDSKDYPKILILCHNIYELNNNIGKTLISLLSSWPKEKICQIYLRDDIPSFNFCYNYYRILDKEILNSYFKGKNVVGNSFDILHTHNDSSLTDIKEQKMYNIGNRRIPFVSLCRDIIWEKKSWKNNKLDKWLEDQKPEIILFIPNDYELIYPIADYIKNKCNIPIVPYYMDDAFYYGSFVSFIDYFRRIIIRKKARKMLKDVPIIITIGPKMSELYSKRFKKRCIELMNSVELNSNPLKRVSHDDYLISYVGNLHSNRWKSIVEIGKRIDKLHYKAKINIYSSSYISKKIINIFDSIKSINFNGSIKPCEVNHVLEKSDILLFVESFNKKISASTKYSLSTKIPEYLNSYRKIFAYGPSDISSIEYLRKNKLAVVCSSKKNIDVCLNSLFNSAYDIDENSIRKFVSKNHNIIENRILLEKILFERINSTK